METHALDVGALIHPDTGVHPGVVMIPDVWGLADHTRDLAQRLASEGFAVLAMDPYRKTGRPEIHDVDGAMAWIRQLPDPVVLETIQQARDLLAGHDFVSGRKVAVTGFCMGGQYAILAACHCEGFSACVPYYGMLRYEEGLPRELKPRSPLEALGDLGCPMLGLYGEDDPIIPVADVRELEERLSGSSQATEVVLYPGAGHAFMNDTRPEMFRPAVAGDAWGRMVRFLKQHLD